MGLVCIVRFSQFVYEMWYDEFHNTQASYVRILTIQSNEVN